jgi:hypothetical protein
VAVADWARGDLHYGAVVLSAPRDRRQGVEGHYFTDRKTRGEMRFRDQYKKLVETHDAGRELVEKVRVNAQTKADKKAAKAARRQA